MGVVPPVLREHQAFRWLWGGFTVSLIGDQVTLVALPLAGILVVHANAFEMGVLTAAGWLPYLLFSIHTGAWVDRRGGRRRMMMAADAGRALIVATVPVAWALGHLTLAQLYAVAFSTGALSVVFSLADSALYPHLVPREHYMAAGSLMYGSRSLSFLVGPALGGVLVQLLSAPMALVADAVSFVASALALGRMRVTEPRPEPTSSGHLAAGARFLLRDPIVRACVAATATMNLGSLAASAIRILYMTDDLHVAPALIGVVLAGTAVGGIAGAALTPAVARRIGVGRTLTAGCLLSPAAGLLIPLAGGPRWQVLAMLIASQVITGLGVMLLDISFNSTFTALVPTRLMARVTGAFTLVNYGIRPLGALAGGALGAAVGLRPALWVSVGVAILGVLWLLPSPVPRLRALPDRAA